MTIINDKLSLYTAIAYHAEQYLPKYLHRKAYVLLFELNKTTVEVKDSEAVASHVSLSWITDTHYDISTSEIIEIIKFTNMALISAKADIYTRHRKLGKNHNLITQDLRKYKPLIVSDSSITLSTNFPYSNFLKALEPQTGIFERSEERDVPNKSHDLILSNNELFFVDEPSSKMYLNPDQRLILHTLNGRTTPKAELASVLELENQDNVASVKSRIKTINTEFKRSLRVTEKIIVSIPKQGDSINSLYTIISRA